jgi:hypothetical protein
MWEPATASCTLYAGRKPPSAIFITRGLGIRRGRARLWLAFVCERGGGRDGRLDAPLEVARAGLASSLLLRRELGLVGCCEHCLEVERGLFAARLQRRHTPERGCRSAGANRGPVLCDAFEA